MFIVYLANSIFLYDALSVPKHVKRVYDGKAHHIVAQLYSYIKKEHCHRDSTFI